MSRVEITDNTGQVLASMKAQVARALDIIGGKAETYSKGLCAPRGPKGNAMPNDITAPLRNSITHVVDEEKKQVAIGSNQPMAAYVELGTGKLYEPPEEWLQTTVQKGTHSGLDKWIFYDEKEKRFRIGLPMSPTPFLQPAIKDHLDEYEEIIKSELSR